MVTNRAQWLILLGVAGSGVGTLLNKGLLAHVSLTVLVWLFVEWLLFRWRVDLQLRHLRCERSVNGSNSDSGNLWTGRSIRVRVRVIPDRRVRIPLIRFRDWLPENLDCPDGGHEFDARMSGEEPAEFEYVCTARGAGSVDFRGVTVRVFDLQGLFFAQKFLPARQTFRVLPTSVVVDATHPTVKRVNSLPPPGIHRLQRAGMGSELLELREYVPGDPPKAIAWKVSARRGQLMTREYESEVPVRTTLFVDHSYGARLGPFGKRPLDQIIRLAASISRSAMTVRDPVGICLFNDAGVENFHAGAGDRHFFQILNRLTAHAANLSPPPVRFSEELLNEAWGVCEQLHPELLDPEVNLVPFTWFPIGRRRRFLRRRRVRLANVFTELYSLAPDAPQQLLFDDVCFASLLQRFLLEAGFAWTWPVVDRRGSEMHDWDGKFETLTDALTKTVARSHDHELFVLLIDLLDHSEPPGRLADSIRLARARHHRVAVICPCPDDCRPGSLGKVTPPPASDVPGLLKHAERVRRINAAEKLQRELRRLGVPVAFASDGRAVQLVLTEAELARTGRTSRTGSR